MNILSLMTLCPDQATAEAIADALIAERLVACANLHAPVQSRYRWQGRIEIASEVPLVVKTRPDLRDAVQAAIRALHPYDVPPILDHAETANDDYAEWVRAETREPAPQIR